MNNAEAKFILQGYRPNGADADDATFGAALEQARNDPTLAEWFARQRAFDTAISTKLAQVEAPAELRAAILAGGRVSGLSQTSLRWWKQSVWLAAAAGFAVLLAVGVVLWPKQATALSEFALADARLTGSHIHGQENNKLETILSNPATKLGQRLPINFASLRESGCRTIGFRGHDVLEVCFERKGVWFHAYLARAADFPGVAKNRAPRLEDRGGAALASWSDDEHVIVVVSKTGRKNLEALL